MSGDLPPNESISSDLPEQSNSAAAGRAALELRSVPLGEAETPHQFCASVLKFLRKWTKRQSERGANPGGVCAVVQGDLYIDGERLGCGDHIRDFDLRTAANLSDTLFVATARARTARPMELAAPDPGSAADILRDSDLGNRPAIIADLTDGIAWIYYRGVAHEDSAGETEVLEYDLNADPQDADLVSVESHLEEVYSVCLATPKTGLHLWHDPRKGIPTLYAEREVQGLLHMFLGLRFPESRIVEEAGLGDSRSDLLIEPGCGRAGEVIVLELKVLRSKSFPRKGKTPTPYSEENNLDGLRKGLDQSVDYRERLKANHVVLCAYDMRDDDDHSIIKKIAAHAKKHSVRVKRYYLYRSADHKRSSKPGAARSSRSTRRKAQ